MAELIRLKLKDLYRGDRLRPVDMGIAAAIGASFEERGQISPITVRRTPAKGKGTTPYTLVAGANRCSAAEIIGWEEVDALVVEADGSEAQLIEIAENLYRNELNALDRAMFVMKYRELWEETHGKIERGGDRRSNPHDADLIFTPGREVAAAVKEKLGFSEDKYERAVRIGKNLHPTLRSAVRGTEAETDQSKLLKLAKLSADDQLRVAASLKEKPDLKLALSWLKPEKSKADPQAELLKKLLAAWENASEETRQEFLIQIGAEPDGTLGEMMADIKSEAKAA